MKTLIFLLTILFLPTFNAFAEGDSSVKNKPTQNQTGLEELPPDPGEAGKATLAGIDSDNDGVRDDLQRYIALTYPDSEKIRRVLTDKIKADTVLLLNAEDKVKVLEIDKLSSKALHCFFYIDPKNASKRLSRLKAKMLNTEERTRAWIRVNSHFGGMTFRLPDDEKAQCSFDPDTLPN